VADPPSGRRTRLIVVISLGVAAIVAVVAFIALRHAGARLDRQTADAKLCTSAASSLMLVNPNMASGVPDVGFRTSRTTAGRLAADLARAGASAHPWDQEARDTVVVRCQSSNLVWLADAKGHAGRLPRP
jgi:hypothetical protein